ncbi:MAG: DUF4399 domain-containing protein [Gemmatimonadota bacterium]
MQRITTGLPARARSGAFFKLLVLGSSGLLFACSDGETTSGGEEAAVDSPTASEASVFFVEPTDGATVPTSFVATFGAENIEIGAVPAEVDAPRPGIVHHHLGVDAECLPPGTVVPQASPWIHFGTGANEIEMNLTPGEHILSVQAGDDEHRTIDGLCETITVQVVE